MTTTVLYRVPYGYLSEISRIRATMPDATESEVIHKWAMGKFGIWIADNITMDFVIPVDSCEPTAFAIVFDSTADARQFVRDLGGAIR